MSNIEFHRRDLITRFNPILGFKFNANYDVIVTFDHVGFYENGFYCEIRKQTGAYGELRLKSNLEGYVELNCWAKQKLGNQSS